jgi:hypothetical protein
MKAERVWDGGTEARARRAHLLAEDISSDEHEEN